MILFIVANDNKGCVTLRKLLATFQEIISTQTMIFP